MTEYGSSDNAPLDRKIDKDFYTIGVQAKWNLYDGKIKDNNLQKAKIENLKVKEQVNLAKEGIYLKVRNDLTET